jgi:hypothetical protein
MFVKQVMEGFPGLLSIKSTAPSWLTSLSIDLSIYECVSDAATDNFSGGCSRHLPECYIPGSQKFVQSAVLYRKYKEMIHWKALCLHLAVSITPHQLKLWIRCELDKIETAEEIISPLKALPVLRSCGIRFNSDPFATELQDVAREIALELTNRRSYALDCPFGISIFLARSSYRSFNILISSQEMRLHGAQSLLMKALKFLRPRALGGSVMLSHLRTFITSSNAAGSVQTIEKAAVASSYTLHPQRPVLAGECHRPYFWSIAK